MFYKDLTPRHIAAFHGFIMLMRNMRIIGKLDVTVMQGDHFAEPTLIDLIADRRYWIVYNGYSDDKSEIAIEEMFESMFGSRSGTFLVP